jgi:hypothetical protein
VLEIRRKAWARWKRFGAAAARAQSNALMWLLYFLVLVPVALLQRLMGDGSGFGDAAPAAWVPHQDNASDLARARRQY